MSVLCQLKKNVIQYFSKPLTIIKVQHKAATRVVQPLVSPCDWWAKDGDK